MGVSDIWLVSSKPWRCRSADCEEGGKQADPLNPQSWGSRSFSSVDRELVTTSGKYVTNSLWEIHARWSFVEGYLAPKRLLNMRNIDAEGKIPTAPLFLSCASQAN